MPLYEYRCPDCEITFEKLRPMSKADAPAICVRCGHAQTKRAISLFSAVSKGGDGGTRSVSGAGGGCASCAATSCSTCGH